MLSNRGKWFLWKITENFENVKKFKKCFCQQRISLLIDSVVLRSLCCSHFKPVLRWGMVWNFSQLVKVAKRELKKSQNLVQRIKIWFYWIVYFKKQTKFSFYLFFSVIIVKVNVSFCFLELFFFLKIYYRNIKTRK